MKWKQAKPVLQRSCTDQIIFARLPRVGVRSPFLRRDPALVHRSLQILGFVTTNTDKNSSAIILSGHISHLFLQCNTVFVPYLIFNLYLYSMPNYFSQYFQMESNKFEKWKHILQHLVLMKDSAWLTVQQTWVVNTTGGLGFASSCNVVAINVQIPSFEPFIIKQVPTMKHVHQDRKSVV